MCSAVLSMIDFLRSVCKKKIISEYDQENNNYKLQKNPLHSTKEPHNNHGTPGRQTKHINQLSLPHCDNCKTRMDVK